MQTTHKVTDVSSPQVGFILADGSEVQVIQVRAEATGGYFHSASDDQGRDWTAPDGKTIAHYEVKILSQGGDRNYNVSLTSNTSIHAEVHAKGHPRGDAQNHSWIEIQVWVTLS
jgi:hypothetical protein